MKEHVLAAFGFTLTYAKKAVEDIPQEKMNDLPSGLVQHPAWILGHLAMACDGVCKMLGALPGCPADWEPLFKMGSKPSSSGVQYPDKTALLEALEEGHDRVTKAFQDATDDALAQPMPDEIIRAMFPTTGNFVVFLMTGHEGMHLGQLMAWRRAQSMNAAFGI